MGLKSIQEILKSVEQPSRYTGKECNAVFKENDQIDVRIALAFPDLYEIGTSHFGIQILYNILNKEKGIFAERVYTPAPDMENELRENHIPMFSRETKTPLGDFDIIGFSLLYELNYTNVLTLLDLAHIPFLSADRDDTHPLIISGGPCTFNPEPVADIFDAMVVGDGEHVIVELSKSYAEWKKSGASRHDLLKKWSSIQGIYIPSFFTTNYVKKEGYSIPVVKPIYDDYRLIRKTIVSDLEEEKFPTSPVIPFGRPVHERLRLEISRGCSRGCRFCQAGMIYRPVRERSVEKLVELADCAIRNTGYEDLSLLSLSAGDYENIGPLMLRLLDLSDNNQDTHKNISFSLPSVRAGMLNSELMEIIKKVRKTGFTIAPEAGSQRLRDVINKGITEEDIVNTVNSAFELGWNVIKLYFMIGLPTETEDDLEEMVNLVKRLREVKKNKRKKAQIHVSVTTFIPKSHSPFQWEKQMSQEDAWASILWLKERLKFNDVSFKWGKTQVSFLEGLIARGDRRLTPVIINAYKKGCRLDGWSEHFRLDLWQQAIHEAELDTTGILQRERDIDEPLPWDHIDSGVSRQFLADERDKSRTGLLTEDCRYGSCSGCGICDFKKIQPHIIGKYEYIKQQEIKAVIKEKNFKKIKCIYTKTGDAKFLGHMELVNLISRCIRRSGFPVKYSSGFHKIIKLICGNPLPVGYESLEEFFIIEVHEDFDTNNIMSVINSLLPEDLRIINVLPIIKRSDIQEKPNKRFVLTLTDYIFSQNYVDTFNESDRFNYDKVNKKGLSKTINLKDFVKEIKIEGKGKISFDLMSYDAVHVRPDDAIKHIFSISENEMKKSDIMKLRHFG